MKVISLFLFSSHSAQNNIQEVIINRPLHWCHLGCGKLCGGFFDEGIYRQYIGAGCIRSALTRKKFLVSKGIYRQYIGTGCTRSVLARNIIFLRFSTLVDKLSGSNILLFLPNKWGQLSLKGIDAIFSIELLLWCISWFLSPTTTQGILASKHIWHLLDIIYWFTSTYLCRRFIVGLNKGQRGAFKGLAASE